MKKNGLRELKNLIKLSITKRTNSNLLELMKNHYSQPKGFVGRNICYAITYGDNYYGHIVGGSAVLGLMPRDVFFNIKGAAKKMELKKLNTIVNNIFYNISKVNNQYPLRNFTTEVLKKFTEKIIDDWEKKYGDKVMGFETLVELPRKGELYLKNKWVHVGTTKGFTCKRVAGTKEEKFTGKRVWDYNNLRPKLILCKKVL
jgi:hypothetical protein